MYWTASTLYWKASTMCWKASVLLAVVVATASGSSVQQRGPVSERTAEAQSKCDIDHCAGTNHVDPKFLCGDPRLGPIQLPTRMSLGSLVHTYDRLGGVCPGEFLRRWFNTTTNSYNYPPQDGFQLDTANNPILGTQRLLAGMKVDRFGSEYGYFLAAAGAPYNQRAIPPSNLATPGDDTSYPFNYHVYEVLSPFDVQSGPIAGWFEQPGQGVQYFTSKNIRTLIAEGFLGRVISSRISFDRLLQTPH
ncbi:hypothetical protein BV898_00429 [Hypsibius exemplaris]|uniref:TNT domain-containing protein n=1 Tax=Hypsibius exemplaris TaxID=2072580 RepID=A0A1W0XDK9_HYPEX|nr:hypothetical protein BV898_00429 [Hypsibius exemplaris]